MKKYHYITSLLLAGSSLLMSGCQDDFSELKQDPSTVTKGDIGYLFAQGVLDFEPSDYTYCFIMQTRCINGHSCWSAQGA